MDFAFKKGVPTENTRVVYSYGNDTNTISEEVKMKTKLQTARAHNKLNTAQVYAQGPSTIVRFHNTLIGDVVKYTSIYKLNLLKIMCSI